MTQNWLPTLLAFAASPGRYTVARREPAELFGRLTEVLQLACDRRLASLGLSDADHARASAAARFFVAHAMLRPGADHYTLLGLTPDFDPDRLREHYRLLMRLTHPDFAASANRPWPADSATRINMAKDVLSSAVRRAAYDRLQAVTSQPSPPPSAAPPVRPARPAAPKREPEPARRAAFRIHRATHGFQQAVRTILGLPGMAFFGTRSGTIALAGFAVVLSATMVWMSGAGEERRVAAAPTGPLVTLPPPEARHPSWAAPRPLPPVVTDVTPPPPQESEEHKPIELTIAEAPEAQLAPRTPVVPPAATPARSSPPPVAGAMSPPGVVPVPSRPVPRTLNAPPIEVAAAPPADVRQPQPPAALVASTRPAEPEAVLPRLDRGVDAPAAALPAPMSGRISMADVQPALANVVSAMQSGRAEEVLAWLDRSAKRGDTGAQFVQAYNQALSGARVLKVGKVQFRGRAFADQMVVDGVVQLHVADDNPRGSVRDVHLRAFFVQRDSGPVLTDLRSGTGP